MGEVIEPEGWPRPRGYANGVRARGAGECLAVAGQIGWNTAGDLANGFGEQFELALANVVEVVRAGGGQAEHIISMTVYIVDRAEYVAARRAIGAAWKRIMGATYPAMALVVVAGLLEAGALVEIQALAVVPS